MSGVAVVLEDLHRAEVDLHLELHRVAERHGSDHELEQALCDLADWSAAHVEQLAGAGLRFGLELEATTRSTNRVVAGVRRKSSELLGGRPSGAVMLVNDLRQIYGNVSLVQLDWELLSELGRAQQDHSLVELAQRCRAETQGQLTAVEMKLKEAVVQAMARA